MSQEVKNPLQITEVQSLNDTDYVDLTLSNGMRARVQRSKLIPIATAASNGLMDKSQVNSLPKFIQTDGKLYRIATSGSYSKVCIVARFVSNGSTANIGEYQIGLSIINGVASAYAVRMGGASGVNSGYKFYYRVNGIKSELFVKTPNPDAGTALVIQKIYEPDNTDYVESSLDVSTLTALPLA